MSRRKNRNTTGSLNSQPAWKRPLLLILGWVFVALGLAGLFLPFLQGILFLLVGVYLLALGSARVRLLRQRARRWLRERYPERMAQLEAAERRAMNWIRARTARFRRDRNEER
jgi:uncharacterized membrane protein YbaN (DUF454 family)